MRRLIPSHYPFFALCFAALLTACAGASNPDILPALKPVENQWDNVQSPFDEEKAREMLEPGEGSISGRSYVKLKMFEKTYASNEKVYLVPMTPYMEEWYARFYRSPGVGFSAYMSPQVAQYAATVQTDTSGHFRFDNVKPGRYMLYTKIGYVVTTQWQDQVGTETGYNAFGHALYSQPVYGETQTGLVGVDHHTLKVVTLTPEAPVLDLGEIH